MTIPLLVTTLIWGCDSDAKHLLLLTTAGHTSLLPLLFRPEEALLRALLLVVYSLLLSIRLGKRECWTKRLHYMGLVAVVAFDTLGDHTRYPFLPLLLYSVVCSAGLIAGWMALYANFIFDQSHSRKRDTSKAE